MNLFETQWNHFLQQYQATGWPVYEVAGGKCALSPDKTQAIVWCDGRYPKQEDGYSINEFCTETTKTLWGACVLEIDDKLIVLPEGKSYAIMPHKKYSITGKCISHVTITPPWDSSQNSFIDK